MAGNANSEVNPIISEVVKNPGGPNDGRELSLEQLALLLTTDRVHFVEGKIKSEFSELKKRQDQVRVLHNLMKVLNKLTDDKGALDISNNQEVQALMKEVKDLGVNIDETKTKYTKDERDRLIENVRMTIEDLNVQNDLQMQTISRLTNERYEAFQMARTILKPLHEAKLNHARGIAGH